MSYQCAHCQHIFNEEEAICEDRTDLLKCLGCPACQTFLIPTTEIVDFHPPRRFWQFLLGVVIIATLVKAVIISMSWLLFAKLLFASSFVITLLYMLFVFIKGKGMPVKTNIAK